MEKTATIFDIQRFSLNDGGGIRTIVFFKGCPLRCQWCSNPESQSKTPEILYWKTRCFGCGECVKVCPEQVGCQQVNSDVCIYCESCIKACAPKALVLSGKQMTIDEVIERVKRDQVFYRLSQGGVTLSGGEVLSHWEFASELAERLNEMMIDVAVETCGYAQWDHAWSVFQHCDTILYDLKIMDREKHKSLTGVYNDLILENARKLSTKAKHVVYRIPLIHNINDSEENIRQLCQFAQETGVPEIHLLPYHEYGSPKYIALGKEYVFCAQTPSDEHIESLRKLIGEYGLSSVVGG